MTPQQFFDQYIAPYQEWAAPAIGFLAALGVFLLGRWWVGVRARRRRSLHAKLMTPPAAERDPNADPFAQGSAVERRASLRRSGNAVPVLISDASAVAKPYPGWVVDRSMGGLGLSVQEAVAPGTILSVRTASAPATVPWIQVEVRNCRPAGTDFELGCQFVKTPPWSVLLLFG